MATLERRVRVDDMAVDQAKSALQPALDYWMQNVLEVPKTGDGTGALVVGTLLLGISAGSQLATAQNTGRANESNPSVRHPRKGWAELSLPNRVKLEVTVLDEGQNRPLVVVSGEYNWFLGPSERNVSDQVDSVHAFLEESFADFKPKHEAPGIGSSLVSELEKLSGLRRLGHISQDDFDQAKRVLLAVR
jgi:hypothetical protein